MAAKFKPRYKVGQRFLYVFDSDLADDPTMEEFNGEEVEIIRVDEDDPDLTYKIRFVREEADCDDKFAREGELQEI